MGTVCCSESVVDIAVGIGCKFGDESLLALLDSSFCSLLFFLRSILGESTGLAFFLGIIAEILEEKASYLPLFDEDQAEVDTIVARNRAKREEMKRK